MSEPIAKHSRMPRKMKPQTELTALAKMPAKYAQHKLAGVDPQKILARYLSTETTVQIAADYGATREALVQYLLKHAEDDWKEAQVVRAIGRKEAAEDALAIADDPMKLARARELLKSAQWDLERVCRRIYGQDHNFNLNVNITDLGDRLRRARERIVTGTSIEIGSTSQALPLAHTRDGASQQRDKEASSWRLSANENEPVSGTNESGISLVNQSAFPADSSVIP